MSLSDASALVRLTVLSAAGQLTVCLALCLLFLPLARHDRRPYLRLWAAAWGAQALADAALLVLLGGLDPRSAAGRSVIGLCLWLAGAHGILVLAAARSYARGGSLSRTHIAGLALLVAWAVAGPLSAAGPPTLLGRELFLLGALYLAASGTLWPLRESTTVGLNVAMAALAIAGLVFVVDGLASGAAFGLPAILVATAPGQGLVLQVVVAFGVFLAVLEGAQFALSATNADLSQAQQRLRTLAQTDPLTGCSNRRVFRELVNDLRADETVQAGTVLLLDVDGLKLINEQEGPAAGDAVIRGVADAIRSRTRPSDLLVRWGGDEFVVVLPGVSFVEGEARRAQIAAAVVETGLSATAGIAAYGPGKDIVQAVADADRSLQERKSQRG